VPRGRNARSGHREVDEGYQSYDASEGRFSAIKEAPSSPGAAILAAHIEGPLLALARKGAHDPANLQPVELERTERLVGSGMVRVMTLAPELPGAKEAIRLLRDGGVVASAGHTEASYEEMLRVIDSGLPMGIPLQRYEFVRAPCAGCRRSLTHRR
jgi:N-acetylglucosamine-6-phosphate deacetylase